MDVTINNVDDIIASANKAFREGNYKGALSLLEPLLKKEKRKTLSPMQELAVASTCSGAHRCLANYKTAFPHAKRVLELAIQLCKGSKEHADVLQEWRRS